MSRRARRFAVALAVAALCAGFARTTSAAVITIVNDDPPGVGMNDPAPRTPVGGNTAITLGSQRFAALQFAADIWGAYLASPVEIRVSTTFQALSCSGFAALLGSAGPESAFFGFANAVPNVLYPSALADKVAGVDLDPGFPDIVARFNSTLGTGGGCSLDFYLGLDASPPVASAIDLVSVALHELGHGLGFVPIFDVQTGAEALGLDDVYELGLEQHGIGLLSTMSNAGRAAAAKDDGNLHFVGPTVTAAIGSLLGGVSGGHVQMYAPTTLQLGSSVSHFDLDVSPNELMEPAYTGPNHAPGLAFQLLCDVGWGPCGTCGDGDVAPNEGCDDGGTTPGDGCDALCRIEPCHTCSGEPSVCPPVADATPCDDGSACTTTDACLAGSCVGADPVTCSPLDQCHDVGVCNPLTGLCSDPPKADGAACSDGDGCTAPDTCQSGVCSGPPSCIDSFLCSLAKPSKLGGAFVPPPAVSLVDALESLTVGVAKPKAVCLPAERDGDPIADALTHLESYPVKATTGQPKHVKRTAVVDNPLGLLTLETVKPSFLLVPTNLSLAADPAPVAPTIEVDHYKCYAAKVASGTPKFPKGLTVSLTTQFTGAAQSFAVKKPSHLCFPVDKNGEGIHHPDIHQVCYQVKPTVKNPTHAGVFLHTQFGAERVDASKENLLCVPSLGVP